MTPSSFDERFEQVKERWLKSSGITTLDFIKSELDKRDGEYKDKLEKIERIAKFWGDRPPICPKCSHKVKEDPLAVYILDLLRSKT
jgi:hypothetical protein